MHHFWCVLIISCLRCHSSPRNCDGYICYNDLYICLSELGEDVAADDLQKLVQKAHSKKWKIEKTWHMTSSDIYNYWHMQWVVCQNVTKFINVPFFTKLSWNNWWGGSWRCGSYWAQQLQSNHVEGLAAGCPSMTHGLDWFYFYSIIKYVIVCHRMSSNFIVVYRVCVISLGFDGQFDCNDMVAMLYSTEICISGTWFYTQSTL